MNDSYEIPVDEIPLAESVFITGHLTPYHHRWWKDLTKGGFKKVIKNESREAFKINVKAYHTAFAGQPLSQRTSELFDDVVDHPEKLRIDSQFLQTLKLLKLYPNDNFPEWNQHVEIYNILEKNNFPLGNAVEMYLFLKESFFIGDYKNLISLDLLKHRDFNIFLILFHLDSLIFKDNFFSVSLYKHLLLGKIKGKRKSSNHLFWNLVKVIACMESNKKKHTSFDMSKKVPKDEESFSLIDESQAERIKYAVRQLKEGKKNFFLLSHFYQMVGAKTLHEDTTCFNGFSLTGLWLIYLYVPLLIRPGSEILKISENELDMLFAAFNNKNKSESTNCWPSDLFDY
ncbi:hypothetical protein [Acinetobacter pseudolwoffii]|uniref:hypothetical protein n=1 Tax=Acinetobacter pseudolwoffii TaxID=2053287 RepID=UPI002578F75C|nr:hypothetical protein [Acinetobacter pseudolwoffii]MDM1342557.1 hypothetical protein [Acinetobacter pseudolwoffii]